MDIKLITQYPRSVATIKDLPQFLSDNPKVYTYFQYQTKTDYNELTDLLNLKNGKPHVNPKCNLSNSYGQYCYGQTVTAQNKILIRENVLIGLEIAKLETTIYNTSFVLAVTVLHELVHYLRGIKRIEDTAYEPGNDFERWSFGTMINLENAAVLNNYQHSFHHLKQLILKDKNVIHDYKAKQF